MAKHKNHISEIRRDGVAAAETILSECSTPSNFSKKALDLRKGDSIPNGGMRGRKRKG